MEKISLEKPERGHKSGGSKMSEDKAIYCRIETSAKYKPAGTDNRNHRRGDRDWKSYCKEGNRGGGLHRSHRKKRGTVKSSSRPIGRGLLFLLFI